MVALCYLTHILQDRYPGHHEWAESDLFHIGKAIADGYRSFPVHQGHQSFLHS